MGGGVLMAIATTTQYWTSRMFGENPTSLTTGQDNESFSAVGTDGAAGNGSWTITGPAVSGSGGQTLSITPTSNDYTIVACFTYGDTAVSSTPDVCIDGSRGVEKLFISHILLIVFMIFFAYFFILGFSAMTLMSILLIRILILG